jgi:hypothetical protein
MRWEYRLAVAGPAGGAARDWVAYSDDPAPTTYTTGGVSGLLLDGLKLTRKLPEDEPWPCQPSSTTLTFQVAAATAEELSSQLLKGSAVAFRIRQSDEAALWSVSDWFTGYITSVQLEARGGHTVAVVTCLDWITQLGEVIIGDEVWPLEGAPNRISRVFGQVATYAPELPAGWDYYSPADDPGMGWHVGMTDADVDARPALEVLLEVLACWPTGRSVSPSAPDLGRYQLVAYHASWAASITAPATGAGAGGFLNLLTVDGWRLRGYTSSPTDKPPARLAQLSPGGLWGVVMDPTALTPWLPAGAVELPTRWEQRIGDIPNTAVVVAHFEGYAAKQEKFTLRWALPQAERKPRVRIVRTVPLEVAVADDAFYQSGVDAVFKLAMLLIPNTVNPHGSWGVEELTWRADMEDEHRTWPFTLGRLLTVTGVDPASHPTGNAWIHGQLDSYAVTVSDGMPEVAFTLRPQLRDAVHDDVLTWADLPAVHPTLAELDPDLLLHDLRLLRV